MKKCKCGKHFNSLHRGALCPACREGWTPEFMKQSRESIRFVLGLSESEELDRIT